MISKRIAGTDFYDPIPVIPLAQEQYNPLGMVQVSAASVVTLAPPVGTILTIIAPESRVRFRDDGVNPTSSVGMPIQKDATWFYPGDASKIKIISQAGPATVNVSYYGMFGDPVTVDPYA